MKGQALQERCYIHKVANFRFRDARTFFPGLSDKTVQRRLARLEGLGRVRRAGRGEGARYHVASLHDVATPAGATGPGRPGP